MAVSTLSFQTDRKARKPYVSVQRLLIAYECTKRLNYLRFLRLEIYHRYSNKPTLS